MEYNKLDHFIVAILIFLSFLVLLPQSAHAYIDPGTGSLIFQLVIAFGVGTIFVVKIFWHKVKKFFLLFIPKNKRNEH